jgi:hypothetical protein
VFRPVLFIFVLQAATACRRCIVIPYACDWCKPQLQPCPALAALLFPPAYHRLRPCSVALPILHYLHCAPLQ